MGQDPGRWAQVRTCVRGMTRGKWERVAEGSVNEEVFVPFENSYL